MSVEALLERELERFEREHPRSRELADEARGSLLSGVPMPWMIRWPGGFPVFAAEAHGARFRDVDGHEYVDFCLGDTAAMTGHSPEPTVRAVAEQAAKGITTMLPSEDALWVGRELTRRFGLARWQFALTATDANRFAIRLARELTGRPKILVFNWCYHGSVDETFVGLEDGRVVSREGNVGPPVPLAETTRVVEWNDAEALERELAHGDVACVLAEPALTNIGIVLPEPGFHEQLRAATREAGTLLIIDETHTLCAGPGGYTAAHGLEPDLLTVGKSIGAGIPVAAYGFSTEVAERLEALLPADEKADVGGIGGTVAAERALARGHARDPRRGADRRGLRADDRPRRALRGGRRGDDRTARPAMARDPPRLPGRVPLPSRAPAHRERGRGRRQPAARPADPPLRAQPRHPADAVPQHGADVARTRPRPTSTCTPRVFDEAAAELA